MGRTEYSARNSTVAVISRVSAILMGFIARVVFTHTLSSAYVGINGLFSDILNIMAISELGAHTAVSFALYKPIASGDTEKQKTIMRMFRRFYHIVAGIILAGGLAVIPFLGILIRDKDAVPHLTLIYLLYVANSVLSYIGIYRKIIIDAHQQSYIPTIIRTAFWILQNILQIVVLLLTRNFILYLCIWIVCTVVSNICIYIKAGKMYPFLDEKDVKKLEDKDKLSFDENVKAMMIHKAGSVIVNNTDNLLLSSLVGTIALGCYSNYYLIIGSVRQVLEQLFEGMTASIGEMNVRVSKDRIIRVFDSIFFIGQWVYGLITIMLFEILDVFVSLSFGSQYRFDTKITIVLCMIFYFSGMRQPVLIFRNSMGLFKYDKWKAVAEAVINLAVSLVLGFRYGTVGVFLGTLISLLLTSFWVEPFMFYRHRLGRSCLPYFLKYAYYTFITMALLIIEHSLIDRLISGMSSWGGLIIRILITFGVTNLVYMALYRRNPDFVYLRCKASELLENRFTE
ncbi:MAG: lipopolysaccharide biosynthesis protein [Lachnospiraceae bacterium]|nr:lipopolysaccharide biosynthesis protein [Lachnospiraceae bacterium]